MSASLSNVLTCQLIHLYLLKRGIYYRCFKRSFSESIQASSLNLLAKFPNYSEQLLCRTTGKSWFCILSFIILTGKTLSNKTKAPAKSLNMHISETGTLN